jgi:DNA-binding beta-propeller fold protein YncE
MNGAYPARCYMFELTGEKNQQVGGYVIDHPDPSTLTVTFDSGPVKVNYKGQISSNRVSGRFTQILGGRTITGPWTALLIKPMPLESLAAQAVPSLLTSCWSGESEGSRGESCSNWIRKESSFVASDCYLIVERFDSGGVVLSGWNIYSHLLVSYQGMLNGDRVTGTVTWTRADGKAWTGAWNATLPASSMQHPSLSPERLPDLIAGCQNNEGETKEECFTWRRSQAKFIGLHPNNVRYELAIEKLGADGVLIHSVNQDKKLTVTYTGTMEGSWIHGAFTLIGVGYSRKGTWSALVSYPVTNESHADYNIYVVCDRQVSIVNMARHTVKNVPVPEVDEFNPWAPLDVAVSADGMKAYIADENGDIYFVDAAASAVTRKWNLRGSALPAAFSSIALSPDGSMLYGIGPGAGDSSMIGFMDLLQGKIIDTLKLKAGPYGTPPQIAVAGKNLYAGAWIVDVPSRSVTALVHGYAADGVRAAANDQFVYLNARKTALVDPQRQFAGRSMIVTRDGNKAYMPTERDGLLIMTGWPDGGKFETTRIFPMSRGPKDIAMSPDGATVFVTDPAEEYTADLLAGQVYTINAKTGLPDGIIHTATSPMLIGVQPSISTKRR